MVWIVFLSHMDVITHKLTPRLTETWHSEIDYSQYTYTAPFHIQCSTSMLDT